MLSAPPFPPFDITQTTWIDWRRRLVAYCEAAAMESPERKLATLKFVGGSEITSLLEHLPPVVAPGEGLSVSLLHSDVFLEALFRLDDHFEEIKNTRLERAEFVALAQNRQNPIERFLSASERKRSAATSEMSTSVFRSSLFKDAPTRRFVARPSS